MKKYYREIIFVIIIAIGIIWYPLIILLNQKDPANYDSQNSLNSTTSFLKYDYKIYQRYLRPGEFGGNPRNLDSKVEAAILEEKISYSLYLVGIVLAIFVVDRYKLNSIKKIGKNI